MEKFNRTLRGYDPEEVNKFLDQIIKQVEEMVVESKEKDVQILELEKIVEENKILKEKIEQYTRMEETLNKAILMAQKTSDQIKSTATQESQIIIEDAKKNASRIVNEALVKSEKIEMEASMLKRNVNIFKRRLKDIVESQIEIIDEIDSIEL